MVYGCGIFRKTTTDIKVENKTVEKLDEKTNLKKDSNATVDTKIENWGKAVDNKDIDLEFTEDYTVYDTNKPADPSTGKPPILSERRRSSKVKKLTSKQVNSLTSTDKHEKVNLKVDLSKKNKANKSSDSKLIDKSKTETSEGIPWWKWLIAGGVLVLFVGVVWKLRGIFV